MAIEALPTATACLLKSAQVLSDSASIVKELIDNALDAKALQIDISISPNTINLIEVRDNGCGIAIDDLESLGKSGYTSKLRSLDELKDIGGSSLGFRGVALASATNLGDVSITTRMEGEPFATHISMKPGGGIATRSSASSPIGTTVYIQNLFSKIPVRKQYATREKQRGIQITKIINLLHAYAFARLHVRFRFKLLKTDKHPSKLLWTYSPRISDCFQELSMQIIDRELALQCFMANSKAPNVGRTSFNPTDPVATEGYFFESFLPKIGADLSKISGGHFVSIDSRPVASTRGPFRKVIELFEGCLRAAVSRDAIFKHPFVRLNVVCPRGSYDINVEPAKDDVIFSNEVEFLASACSFFQGVYDEQNVQNTYELNGQSKDSPSTTSSALQVLVGNDCHITPPRSDHGVLINRLEGDDSIIVSEFSYDSEEPGKTKESTVPDFKPQRQSQQTISGRFHCTRDAARPRKEAPHQRGRHTLNPRLLREEQILFSPSSTVASHRLDMEQPDAERCGLNPWVIAKLSATTRENVARSPPVNTQRSHSGSFSSTIDEVRTRVQPVAMLSRMPQELTQLQPTIQSGHEEASIQATLQHWIHGVTVEEDSTSEVVMGFDTDALDSEILMGSEVLPLEQASSTMFIKLPGLNLHENHMPPPATSGSTTKNPIRLSERHKRPFVLPIKRRKPISNHESYHDQETPDMRTTVPPSYSFHDDCRTSNGLQIIDQRRNAQPDVMETVLPTNETSKHSPSGLSSISLELRNKFRFQEALPRTTLVDDDPRAYLLRKNMMSRGYQVGSRLTRSESRRFLFETIPEASQLRNLEQIVVVEQDVLRMCVAVVSVFDEYAERGQYGEMLDRYSGKLEGLYDLQQKLKRVFQGTTRQSTE